MQQILIPIIVLGVMGFLFAIILGIISTKFSVVVDQKEKEVSLALPGANCGACGYPGCDACAHAIATGEAPVEACIVGGKKVADKVAEVMGAVAGDSEKMVAVVKCNGTCDNAKDNYNYSGIKDCRVQIALFEGKKACGYGCLGCGTCVEHCPFDAMYMNNGVAMVDREKCVACGKCVEICPKDIIKLVPYSQKAVVKCMSHDKGKDVRGKCKVGCIGCTLCQKTYPEGFEINKFLASEKLDNNLDPQMLKQAAEKCPNKCIHLYD
ncbi:MAG: RnfABCDGE type electron transport complex subunit B [Tissierellia bacterium]|nr:RnfABCDGE type electron transport complex subunit B [Tissierellia bacterium]